MKNKIDTVCAIALYLLLIPITLIEAVLLSPVLLIQGLVGRDIKGRFVPWFEHRLDL